MPVTVHNIRILRGRMSTGVTEFSHSPSVYSAGKQTETYVACFCATCVFPYKHNCSQFDLSALLPVSSHIWGSCGQRKVRDMLLQGLTPAHVTHIPPPCRYPPVTKETSAFQLTCRDIRDLPPPFVMSFLFHISSPFSLTALIISAYSGIRHHPSSPISLLCLVFSLEWREVKRVGLLSCLLCFLLPPPSYDCRFILKHFSSGLVTQHIFHKPQGERKIDEKQ